MPRRTPNASIAQSGWGGINAPLPPATQNRADMPALKQYPVEQVLYFHERHLHELMTAVGKLQHDASKNTISTTKVNAVDIEAIKKAAKDELSTQFTTQNSKIEKQQKSIVSLRKEIADLKKNLENNVELIVEEA